MAYVLTLLVLISGAMTYRAEAQDLPASHRCGMRRLLDHPSEYPLPHPKPVAALQDTPQITVGTQLDFLVAGDLYLHSGTCRFVGEHCYIFVEDTQWDTNGGAIFQSDVDTLGNLFEMATPADPQRGMYALETETFGPPPDVDGYTRIFIFIVELADSRMVGFFDPRVATWPDPHFRRDTLYLDAGMLRHRPYLARGTLAHEFQHLIHFGADPDEETWINEGLSGYAEALTGFPETDTSMVDAFLAQPDFDLTAWPLQAGAANYGATYLFVAFLAQRYGPELIRNLVAEPRNGVFGITAALQATGLDTDFDHVWADWILANYASESPRYGYSALRGRRVRTYAAPALPFAQVKGVVNRRWGSTTVILQPAAEGTGIRVDLNGEENGRLCVQGYAMRAGQGELTPMELDSAQSGRLEVAQVDSLALIVGRTSPLGGVFWVSAVPFTPTAVLDDAGVALPREARLMPAFPNPFNGGSIIPFRLDGRSRVELAVFDALGQRVAHLATGQWEAGMHQVAWSGQDDAGRPVASGTYVVQLRAGAQRCSRRITLLR